MNWGPRNTKTVPKPGRGPNTYAAITQGKKPGRGFNTYAALSQTDKPGRGFNTYAALTQTEKPERGSNTNAAVSQTEKPKSCKVVQAFLVKQAKVPISANKPACKDDSAIRFVCQSCMQCCGRKFLKVLSPLVEPGSTSKIYRVKPRPFSRSLIPAPIHPAIHTNLLPSLRLTMSTSSWITYNTNRDTSLEQQISSALMQESNDIADEENIVVSPEKRADPKSEYFTDTENDDQATLLDFQSELSDCEEFVASSISSVETSIYEDVQAEVEPCEESYESCEESRSRVMLTPLIDNFPDASTTSLDTMKPPTESKKSICSKPSRNVANVKYAEAEHEKLPRKKLLQNLTSIKVHIDYSAFCDPHKSNSENRFICNSIHTLKKKESIFIDQILKAGESVSKEEVMRMPLYKVIKCLNKLHDKRVELLDKAFKQGMVTTTLDEKKLFADAHKALCTRYDELISLVVELFDLNPTLGLNDSEPLAPSRIYRSLTKDIASVYEAIKSIM